MKNSTSNATFEELESPFLQLTNVKQPPTPPASAVQDATLIASPFQSVYEQEGTEPGYDSAQENLVELMDELYDEEFDELLQEIAYEAQDVYDRQSGVGYGGLPQQEVLVRQSMDEHFAPLLNEVQRFMDYMAEVTDRQDASTMTAPEWDSLVDQYVPQLANAPTFDHFGGWFKKIKNKVKKVAKSVGKVVKKGVSLAKKFGLGFVLKKLKKIILKFLKGILAKGIRKLPSNYRPLAKKLGQKLGILKEAVAYDTDLSDQQAFDGVVAELLLAPTEWEMEMIEQEFVQAEVIYAEDPLSQLDQAREIFVQQIGHLREDEDPEPVIEEFVSAVLIGIKWAVRIIGKKKVKNIAVKLISRLIRKYVGKKYARMLAKHLVGAGFKMLNLELTPEQEVEEGHRAVAAVVEDTVRQIAQLPDHILQNEALLESNVIEAFEASARANFPDVLSESTYTQRPDLREASRHKVAWRLKAIKKGRGKQCRYKKLNQEIDTELTPYLAQEIKTLGGVPLGNVLRDYMGITVDRSMPVRVHLFETLPGADRYHIESNEPTIQGQHRVSGVLQQPQLHPLTSVAAGLLLGEPALGCRSTARCLSRASAGAAHRYYYLQIPGARPQVFVDPTGGQYARRTTGLKLKLNFIGHQLQLFLYLSESDAQHVAAQLRQKAANQAAQRGNTLLATSLKTAFSHHTHEHIRIVHPHVIPGGKSGQAMAYIPAVVQQTLMGKLIDWVAPAFADHLMNRQQEFIAAADADADGLTVCITLLAPADFGLIGQLIGSQAVSLPGTLFAEKHLDTLITTQPGYRYA